MRTPIILLGVAMLAVSFDRLVTTPSADVVLAQNVGPLPTPALNPRLGGPPPGGNLDGNAASRLGEGDTGRLGQAGGALGDRAGSALDAAATGTAADPALPGGRLGAPPAGTGSGAAVGGVAPPAAGAVPPPAAGAVGAQPGIAPPAR